MSKILCFVLIYGEVDIIKKSLTYLTKLSDQLQFVIIENFSSNTESIIKPYVMQLLENKLIWRYYLFSSNITNNAYRIILDLANETYMNENIYPYTIITDGDIDGTDHSWLEEQKALMVKYPNIFVSSCSLDMSNLPTKTFPQAPGWVPKGIRHNDFIEAATGCFLLLFRTGELKKYLTYRKERNMGFLDSAIYQYCQEIIGKKWARTVSAKIKHLTWDLYADLNHPYTQMKINNAHTIWFHNNIAPFELFESK